MASELTKELISDFEHTLDCHPVYSAISSVGDIRCFMEHHVFSVWDFMSLLKCLQEHISPSRCPWDPPVHRFAARFINELVLEEESDGAGVIGGYCSHFELYLMAMNEVGADVLPVQKFISKVREMGVVEALSLLCVPEPSRIFTNTTFDFINSGKVHQVAAALSFGREQIIPIMFRSLLEESSITERSAPAFHHYLKRHIALDGDAHADLSLQLLNELCDGNSRKVEESICAARKAVEARLLLWDGVLSEIKPNE